jgi:hypothetical protein
VQPLHLPPEQVPGRQDWQRPPPLPQSLLAVPGRQTLLLQQPLAQEDESQMHAPLKQRRPVPQAGSEPHRQAPVAVQVSVLAGSQALQLAPPVPHVPSARGLQVEFVQQPVGQEVASQMHELPEQRWPGPQAPLAPQEQVPAAEQPSADFASHEVQAAPSVPQVPMELAWQAFAAEQQPVGHEVASQTQVPLEQRWPGAQAPPLPQAQVPSAAQPSARFASQETQPLPAVAHAAAVGGVVQVDPEQQPAGQLAGVQPLQMPPLQTPGAQDWQAAPPLPQEVSLAPVSQLVPVQHPEQEVESQTHEPPRQRWPAEQGAPPPHWHAPVAVQVSALLASQAEQAPPAAPQVASDWGLHVLPEQQPSGQVVESQTQLLVPVPEAQRCPSAQAGLVPHRQAPPVQLSALVALQARQVEPAVPQVASDGLLQVEPLQQPLGQAVGSQTQAPATQRWPALQVPLAPQAQVPSAAQ